MSGGLGVTWLTSRILAEGLVRASEEIELQPGGARYAKHDLGNRTVIVIIADRRDRTEPEE